MRRANVAFHLAVVVLQGRHHQVLFALEVLVERGLADPHVGEDLVDADVAEAVAIEPREGGIHQPLAGVGGQR